VSASRGTVTLRAPWVLLVIALPVLGLFDVGIIWAVVLAVRHRDAGYPFRGDGFHTTGIVVGWLIASIMLALCLFALVNLVVLRVHFEGDHIRMRKLYRYVTIRLDDLTSVIVTNPPQWQVSAPRSSVAPCLEIRGRRRSGRAAYIGINAKLLDYRAGLLWLAPWLRAHPTITDERTLALLDAPSPGAPGSAPRDTPQASIPAEDLMTKYRDDLR
jgi:hypothetical protein